MGASPTVAIIQTGISASPSAVAIVAIALEVGIEPTARHAADLGIIPVIIADACGMGDEEAGRRSLVSLAFAGDALITETATFCRLISRAGTSGSGRQS